MLSLSGYTQINIQTVAEKSDFKSTSTYSDVISFVNTLHEKSPIICIENIAVTIEGRDVPAMIVANPPVNSPDDIGDRIVVYIQANIHAGEVEGKEASLMLAREFAYNPNSEILKNVVILIVPNLNADGNEKTSTKNRTNQVGPENGVGIRYNGQNLDLNRDAMKVESPEITGVIKQILNRWDPAITVDCHTTNGSFHEEPVTFTWMMNPNGNRSLINYMRDKMMPAVHDTLWDKYNVENVFYGEFIDRMDIDKGWISYASEPRYVVNYIGLRNRLAILNENYVYADYKTRVYGCLSLLKTILEYSSENKDDIKRLLQYVDQQTIISGQNPTEKEIFAIKYEGKPTPEPITIKAFEADTIPGVKGYWRFKKSDRKRTVTVPYIADYYATDSIRIPYAYIINVKEPEVIKLLKIHGIEVKKLRNNTFLPVEEFTFSELHGSERLNQGHYTNIVKGSFEIIEKEFPKDTYVVFTGQKLGNLIAALLEPQAEDGLLKWNYFDSYLAPQWGGGFYPYPVYRVIDNVVIECE